ncbi:Sodium/calcium exchanger 1 [Penaeus vannamei]|uniref:Sodium/calcium exchanger 1 n=1 Tax=Penaeus vannamei TaxID=6689 RepID=A0A423T6F9_PENVA|nr:Sodium/calcium exchanger 1 [Penaeus vannamei]
MVSIPLYTLPPRKPTLTVTRAALGGGYPCFMCSIVGIGLMTAVIGDVASALGCTSFLKDSVTATTFVALGTSMPGDTKSCIRFSSHFLHDPTSFGARLRPLSLQQLPSERIPLPQRWPPSRIPTLTPLWATSRAPNAVNVFLGIGIAWTLAAIYHNVQGRDFEVLPGNLAFSVTLFCVEAAVAIMVMMIRRHPSVGGELGGPRIPKIVTSAFLAFLWVFYVFMSSLEAYDIIPSL